MEIRKEIAVMELDRSAHAQIETMEYAMSACMEVVEVQITPNTPRIPFSADANMDLQKFREHMRLASYYAAEAINKEATQRTGIERRFGSPLTGAGESMMASDGRKDSPRRN